MLVNLERFLFVRIASVAFGVALATMSIRPATAQKVQGIYAGNDPSLSAIDVYYSVGPISVGKSEDVGGGEAVAFLDVPPNLSITASIADASSASISEAFYSDSYSFPADTNYIQIVNGLRSPGDYAQNPDGRNTAIAVHEIDNVRRFASHPDSTELLVYHGSTDAPALDVLRRSGQGVASGLSYGDAGGYFAVSTGEAITFDIRRAGGGELIGSFVGGLSAAWAGRAGVLVIRGFADPSVNPGGIELGVTAVSSSGSSFDFAAVTGTGVVARDEADSPEHLEFDAIYPNPVSETATFDFTATAAGDATIRVFDLLGREAIPGRQIDITPGPNSVGVDLRGIAAGVYSIVVESDSDRIARAMTVVR